MLARLHNPTNQPQSSGAIRFEREKGRPTLDFSPGDPHSLNETRSRKLFKEDQPKGSIHVKSTYPQIDASILLISSECNRMNRSLPLYKYVLKYIHLNTEQCYDNSIHRYKWTTVAPQYE